jgi:hypothetical protein
MKTRPLTSAEHRLALAWGGLVLALMALSPLLPRVAGYLPRCLLRHATGIPCPTCGATRATVALFDGRLVDAVLLNPLVASGVVAFLVGGIIAPLWAWRRLEIPVIDRLPGWARLGILAIIAVNWAWVITHVR